MAFVVFQRLSASTANPAYAQYERMSSWKASPHQVIESHERARVRSGPGVLAHREARIPRVGPLPAEARPVQRPAEARLTVRHPPIDGIARGPEVIGRRHPRAALGAGLLLGSDLVPRIRALAATAPVTVVRVARARAARHVVGPGVAGSADPLIARGRTRPEAIARPGTVVDARQGDQGAREVGPVVIGGANPSIARGLALHAETARQVIVVGGRLRIAGEGNSARRAAGGAIGLARVRVTVAAAGLSARG